MVPWILSHSLASFNLKFLWPSVGIQNKLEKLTPASGNRLRIFHAFLWVSDPSCLRVLVKANLQTSLYRSNLIPHMCLAGCSHLIWHSSFVDLLPLKLLEGERTLGIVFSEIAILSMMYRVLNKLPTRVKQSEVGQMTAANTHIPLFCFFVFFLHFILKVTKSVIYVNIHRAYFVCTMKIFSTLNQKFILVVKWRVTILPVFLGCFFFHEII